MRVRLLLLASILAAGPCAGPAAGADQNVDFQCCQYTPPDVRIAPGEKVTWTGKNGADFNSHPLRFSAPAGKPADETWANTQVSRNFPAATKVTFYCANH